MKDTKRNSIPRHTLDGTPTPGLFVKRMASGEPDTMRSYPHRDDYYMIVLVTGGEAALSIDFRNLTVAAGDALVISPGQIHSPARTAGNVEGWGLALAAEYFSEQEAELAARHSLSPAPVRLSEADAADAETLFEILLRRSDNHPEALPLAEAVKRLVFRSLGAGIGHRGDRYGSIVVRLKELLAANLASEKKPSAYAAMLNLSPVYLNEAVRAVTGKSAGSFIRGQIVLRAKRQLVYTSLSAQEIAFDLGYDDYAYFSRMFRKETGLSPTQYRKTSKNTSNS